MSAPIVAVIGGGQLARMMQEEASALGIRLRALVEAADGSTGQVTPDAPVGAADDEVAVRASSPEMALKGSEGNRPRSSPSSTSTRIRPCWRGSRPKGSVSSPPRRP